MFKKVCPECGKDFENKQRKAKFCCHPCATKFNRRLRPENYDSWSSSEIYI